jgi:predicted transposase YdaD
LTKEAVEYLESSSYSEDELDIYDRYWDSVRTQRTLYIGAIDEGMAKGEAIGIEKGMAKGRAEGRAEGEAIGLQKVVMNAHRAGKSVSDIAAFTGLSEDEVRDMLHKFASLEAGRE